MATKYINNRSRQQMEKATKQTCPRCKGFGGIASDNGERCHLCNGNGTLWLTDSGWTLPIYGRQGEEQLY